jgi:hypothetical protein
LICKPALKGLPVGAKVSAAHKGKGCPFKRKQVRVAGGVADLSGLLAKHQLGAGTLIELKASAPGMTGETLDVKDPSRQGAEGDYELSSVSRQ